MPAPTTTDQFLKLALKSGLVTDEQIDDAGPLPAAPQAAARKLVATGTLTEFQARGLLAGKYRGYVLGPYRVLEHLGSGGMAAVYLARHTVLDRPVALKFLPASSAASPGYLQRFHREAKAAASLDHPHVARCYDVCRDRDVHFIVYEYVEGKSLDHVLKAIGPMPVPVAVGYVVQAAAGLQHAHDRGIVHRDVKPANLILDRSGTVKVLDLGLARLTTPAADAPELTGDVAEGRVLGTADFLAPEQAVNSHEVDARTDVYSLGATLYALLAGRPPFAGNTLAQKLLGHQLGQPAPLADVRGGVPAGLQAAIDRMMAKRPEDRYPSMRAAAEALLPFAGAGRPPEPSSDVFSGVQLNAPGLSGLSGPGSSIVPVSAIGTDAPSAAVTVAATRPPFAAPRRGRSGGRAVIALVGVAGVCLALAAVSLLPAGRVADPTPPAGPTALTPEPLASADELGRAAPAELRFPPPGTRESLTAGMPPGWSLNAWDRATAAEVSLADEAGRRALTVRTTAGPHSLMLFRESHDLVAGRMYEVSGEYRCSGPATVRFRQNGRGTRDALLLAPAADWRPFRAVALATESGLGYFEFHHGSGPALAVSRVAARDLGPPPAGKGVGQFALPPDAPDGSVRLRPDKSPQRQGALPAAVWPNAYSTAAAADMAVRTVAGQRAVELRLLDGTTGAEAGVFGDTAPVPLRTGRLYRYEMDFCAEGESRAFLRDGRPDSARRQVSIDLPDTAGRWGRLDGVWRAGKDGNLNVMLAPAPGKAVAVSRLTVTDLGE